jgi:vacuolar-type H+-ATPase subunit D/Vma8
MEIALWHLLTVAGSLGLGIIGLASKASSRITKTETLMKALEKRVDYNDGDIKTLEQKSTDLSVEIAEIKKDVSHIKETVDKGFDALNRKLDKALEK